MIAVGYVLSGCMAAQEIENDHFCLIFNGFRWVHVLSLNVKSRPLGCRCEGAFVVEDGEISIRS